MNNTQNTNIFKRSRIAADIASALLLLLFLYTALSKFSNIAAFRLTLAQSPLLNNYSSLLSWLIPVTETGICILLFAPPGRIKGLYASISLLVVFTSYILYMLLHKQQLPCSCGGAIGKLSWQQHILFNILFIILSIAALVLYKKQKPANSPP